MFADFCTLIVVISINRLQILPTPWYDSRLGLCLGFIFRVLVRVRVKVRLELQTVFRLLLGCGLFLHQSEVVPSSYFRFFNFEKILESIFS